MPKKKNQKVSKNQNLGENPGFIEERQIAR